MGPRRTGWKTRHSKDAAGRLPRAGPCTDHLLHWRLHSLGLLGCGGDSIERPRLPDAVMADTAEPLTASALNHAQLEQLKQLEAFRPGVRAQLVGLFERNARGHVAELQRAAAAGDLDSIRRSAHSLKGASASIGAAGLSSLLAKLELDLQGTQASSPAVAQLEPLTQAVAASLRALHRWLEEP
jgi:HPt (histidine-containing phosphotransfer) domain-containing protein